MTARGAMTLSKVCGERWPRLMPVAMAAAYCGMQVREFERSRFASLVFVYDGRERVDRDFLDNEIHRMTREAADAYIEEHQA